jgi:hypothetical protein
MSALRRAGHALELNPLRSDCYMLEEQLHAATELKERLEELGGCL